MTAALRHLIDDHAAIDNHCDPSRTPAIRWRADRVECKCKQGNEASLNAQPVFSHALRELVGDPAWQALMPFRLGYPTRGALPSPRRATADVVLAA